MAFAEFVGTFTLIFVGAGSIIATHGGNLTAIALAHGLAIGVMASAVGHISGGHFNPAVTFGFVVTRKIEIHLAAAYWFAQFVGAILAAFLLSAVLPQQQVDAVNLGAPSLAPGISGGRRRRDRGRADLLPGLGDLRHARPTRAARSPRSPASRSASRSRSTSSWAARTPAPR